MPKIAPGDFQKESDYMLAIELFNHLTGILLFQFARQPIDTKNTIIQNFLARTVKMVKGIRCLWEIGDYQGCWILHRCLLDRYFHLVSLGRDSAYELFDDWSFIKQFEAINKIRSEPLFNDARKQDYFQPNAEQRARYHRLKKNPPNWNRPKAEEIAKSLNLLPLYHNGYDFASKHVHPMANDGIEDFYDLTRLEPKPNFPSHVSVLHNTLLVAHLIAIESLNQSDFSWIMLVYEFYRQLLEFLESGNTNHIDVYKKFLDLGPDAELSKAQF